MMERRRLPAGVRVRSLAHSVRKRNPFARGGALGRRLEGELVTTRAAEVETNGAAAHAPHVADSPRTGSPTPPAPAGRKIRLAWLFLPLFLAALPVLLALFGGPEVK